MTKKTCEAFFTVEASALMPFILALYFLFIYELLYIYNLTLLNQDTYYLCEKVREASFENEDPIKEANEIYAIIKEESAYISCRNITANYSKKGHSIVIESSLEFVIPISVYLQKWFVSLDDTFQITKSAYITKPQNIMRMSYKLQNKEN